MDIVDWGPAAWTYLHAVSYSFPAEPTHQDAAEYGRFFVDVGKTLPCLTCRKHYEAFCTLHPPALASRGTLVRWVIDVHNDVRTRQGKLTLGYGAATRDIIGGKRRRRREAVVVASVLVGAAVTVVVIGIIFTLYQQPCN